MCCCRTRCNALHVVLHINITIPFIGQPRRRPPPPPPPLRSNAVNTTAPTASTRHARCEDSSKTLLAAGSQHGADTAASVTRESVGEQL